MKKLKLIIAAITLASSLSANANCERVIKAADAAIAALQVEVKAQDSLLGLQEALINDLAVKNDKHRAELDKWYRNPYTMVTYGIVLGILAGAAVSK